MLKRIEVEGRTEANRRQCMCSDTTRIYETARIQKGNAEGLIKIGENSHIKGELLTLGHGGEIHIGDWSYIGENTYVWSGAKISIGNRVLIGSNCNIFDNDIHPLDAETRHLQFKEIVSKGQPEWVTLHDEKIVIEDDVWIGFNVTVLKGVRIGKGAVVGAGSVVTHDVPEYAVVHGNPAKVSRYCSDNRC